jgi:hypothetical protein
VSTPTDAKQRAADTYNAASDFYDHPVNTFWERYGRCTVLRLRLNAGGVSLMYAAAVALLRSRRQKRWAPEGLFLASISQIVC